MKCPNLATLRLLLNEQLPSGAFREIEAHVEGCADCRTTLERLLTEGEEPGQGKPFAATAAADAGPDTALTAPVRGCRYRVQELYARGGLGEVFKAIDPELNREVALKRMQARYHNDAESRRRFLQEAEITSRLEHPGVVPVYGMDQDAAGQPCYAMRFLRGETLHEAITRFHAADKPGRNPGERSLALRELLGRFVAVCNTVAYAHSRGILHRDLKPGNVMLDKYGQTLVVDWGLAKAIERDEAARAGDEETLTPVTVSDDSGTQLGQAMGTPSYMSPEQASGQWAGVGQASDIYSLGAILYTLVTGQAPFAEGVGRDKLEMVKRGQFPRPRQVNKLCPPALEAVCLKAMALLPEQRYATALALAADVEHWLADEPVGAWPEPLSVRLRRWVRRHRSLAATAATALLLAVLTSGVAFALVQQHRLEQQEKTARVVNEELGQAKSLRKQARDIGPEDLAQQDRRALFWEQALEAAGRAEQALADGHASAETRDLAETLLPELRAEYREAKKDWDMLKKLEKARELSLVVSDADYIRLLESRGIIWGSKAAPAYAAAFQEYGIDLETLPWEEAARRLAQRPIRVHLCAALDTWYFVAPEAAGKHLLDVAQKADPDPLRNWVRAAIAREDGKELQRLAQSAKTLDLPVPTLLLLAEVVHKKGMYDAALLLMERARRQHPDDFWVNDHLGIYLTKTDRPDYAAASRCFAAAVALRPKSAVALTNLGQTLWVEGHLDAAVAVLEESIRVDPHYATGYVALVLVLLDQGEPARARALLQKAPHPDSPLLSMALGTILSWEGNQEEAIETFRRLLKRHPEWIYGRILLAQHLSLHGENREALTILEAMQRAHPQLPGVQSSLASVLRAHGDLQGAETAFRKALQSGHLGPVDWCGLGSTLSLRSKHDEALSLYRKAVRMVPGNASIRASLALGLVNEGSLAEAVATAREAIQLNPKNAFGYVVLGWALTKLHNYQDAEDAFRAALRLQPDDAGTLTLLGNFLVAQRRFDEALAGYETALQRRPKQAALHNGLGYVYFEKKQFATAIEHYQEAVKLAPTNALWQESLGYARLKGNLGDGVKELSLAAELNPYSSSIRWKLALAWRAAKKYDAAEKAAAEAVRLDPQSATAHNVFALTLENNHQLDKAIDEYRKAVGLAPNDAALHFNLSDALYVRKDYAESLAAIERAVALNPDHAGFQNALANTCYQMGEYDRAKDAARKAIAIDPKGAAVAYNVLGLVAAAVARPDEALAHYAQAISLNPKDPTVYVNLGNTLGKKRDWDGAIAQFQAALNIDPEHLDALVDLAGLCWDRRKYDLAVPLLKKVLQIKRRQYGNEAVELSTDLAMLGYSLLQEKKYAEAEAICAECLTIRQKKDANHWGVLVAKALLGQSLLGQKKYAAAEPLLLQGYEGLKQREAKIPLQGRARVIEALEGLARLYDAWGKLDEGAKWRKQWDAAEGYHYEAACWAVLAAAGKSWLPQPPDDAEKSILRNRALKWLRADFDLFVKQSRTENAANLLLLLESLPRWQNDADLASVREAKQLAQLPAGEREGWSKFWAEADAVLKRARTALARMTLTQITFKGTLSSKQRTQAYDLQLTAGITYVIDMHSAEFDTYLKLLDDGGMLLAENDDVAPDNLDSRLIFTPNADGTFRLVATSYQERGTGAFTLTLRATGTRLPQKQILDEN